MELEALEETKESRAVDDEFEDFFEKLDKARSCGARLMGNYQGFWVSSRMLRGLLSLQRHIWARDTDIILASMPKSGTTWLKALVFSIVNRRKYSASQSPLLTFNPLDLVPFLELQVFSNAGGEAPLDDGPNPRILATHVPCQLLPSTILDSQGKIVYICRNPLDQFISSWHFCDVNRFDGRQPLPIAEAFELFFQGIGFCCPFWDHVLGYWNASLDIPEKVLFLKYEDLKKDDISSVKKIADFMGFPFSAEEEKNGLIEELTKLCSFENLRNLDVNKTCETPKMVLDSKNSSFFRKGNVGDWAHHLSPSAVQRFQKSTEEKLAESGLSFEFHHN